MASSRTSLWEDGKYSFLFPKKIREDEKNKSGGKLKYVEQLGDNLFAVNLKFPHRKYKYFVPKQLELEFEIELQGESEICKVVIEEGFLTDGDSDPFEANWDDYICQKEWLIHDWLYYRKACLNMRTGQLIKFGEDPADREAVDTVFKHSDDKICGSLIYWTLRVAQLVGIPQQIWMNWLKDNSDPPFLSSLSLHSSHL